MSREDTSQDFAPDPLDLPVDDEPGLEEPDLGDRQGTFPEPGSEAFDSEAPDLFAEPPETATGDWPDLESPEPAFLDDTLDVPPEAPELPWPAATEPRRVVVFRVDGVRYAASVDQIRQIEAPGSVVPLPGVPKWVLGVTQLRGEIISVIDLSTFLDAQTATPEERRLLVVRSDRPEATSAFIVDQIEGIRSLSPLPPGKPSPETHERLLPFAGPELELEGQSIRLADLGALLDSREIQGRAAANWRS